MEPIRILQVVVSMDAGGIETMLMNYYRNIDRSKIQFDFLLHCKHKSFYEDEIKAMGGRIHRVPSYHPKEHFKYLKALKLFFKEHTEYRVVHSHIKFYGLYVLKAAKKAGVKTRIAHSHIAKDFYTLDKTLPFRIYTRALFSRQYTHVYACSPEAAEYMAPGKDFTMMNNAINAQAFVFDESKRQKIRKEFGLADQTVLGHVGRFAEQKNHDFLIDIFAEVVKERSNARLMLVGNGKLIDKTRQKIESLGLTDKVIFAGIRKDIADLMCAMDIFVFPSLFEGFGIAVLEAESSDLPCVISDIIPDSVVVTDKVKRLSLEKSASDWAKEILATDINKARENRYALIVKKGFDIKTNVDKLEKTYIEAHNNG